MLYRYVSEIDFARCWDQIGVVRRALSCRMTLLPEMVALSIILGDDSDP